ncbi:unnamed protein product [Chondrus crispus]|uniref:Uncharacterized protein n=1 Tax=Chondrus crispus TaxID=2769 RepID=R7QQE8_CHOCR|nr:unnamed protein product [Chondrus crispus]CDF39600.1 unnamed protein product [Chondrus crispus]|eukprot:XP_005709894.1 unnamed protein product [Chondrus crispus]
MGRRKLRYLSPERTGRSSIIISIFRKCSRETGVTELHCLRRLKYGCIWGWGMPTVEEGAIILPIFSPVVRESVANICCAIDTSRFEGNGDVILLSIIEVSLTSVCRPVRISLG